MLVASDCREKAIFTFDENASMYDGSCWVYEN